MTSRGEEAVEGREGRLAGAIFGTLSLPWLLVPGISRHGCKRYLATGGRWEVGGGLGQR